MKQAVARFAPLSLAVVIVGTVTVVLSPVPLIPVLAVAQERRLIDRIRREAPPRNAKVLEEIALLGEHPWAGVYRGRSRSTWNLAIAPAGGFTFDAGWGCEGFADYLAFGSVVADEGPRLKLQIEREHPSYGGLVRRDLDDNLHCVRWGDLQFIVPERSMKSFCAQVADDYGLPSFFFRTAATSGRVPMTDPPRPRGVPQVPREFQHLIPPAPISCRIVSLLEWQPQPALEGNGNRVYDAVDSIDAGSEAGLAAGTLLFIEGVPKGHPIDALVEEVDRDSARVRLCSFGDDRESAEALVGLRAATRFERVGRR